ncbi:deoxyribose-phosphate aldolase [Facklamia miroungae]|uniref:Deoxyribose-phosphate aldolase n=1 Tax=Facklamia miroungae TaxID=120956 RepID=A0A1G7QZ62_9LACT|nr:deoxyribose-phosphate aldolase [Facklamia miroungae]NKZ29119.1 deoxyribose-phosphate aldolase [Facklamia miroungae]SDG03818.1 deoxyribose-phosphate aldolase [Facklamia miroungae]
MKLNKYIDHTILNANATSDQIRQICQEALQYEFMSVCINPVWVTYAKELLKDSEVKVCTVIGFPLGATTTATKVFEAKEAVGSGADEIDMVINIGAAKAGDWEKVEEDIRQVVQAVPENIIVKVIIETSLLDNDEKVKACQAAKTAKADFVKTSTGFSTGGATKEDVALMRSTVGEEMGVKASGGVGDKKSALMMIEAGASRIGASKGIKIVSE